MMLHCSKPGEFDVSLPADPVSLGKYGDGPIFPKVYCVLRKTAPVGEVALIATNMFCLLKSFEIVVDDDDPGWALLDCDSNLEHG